MADTYIKRFVRAIDEDNEHFNKNREPKSQQEYDPAIGKDIKEFYENAVELNSPKTVGTAQTISKPNSKRRKTDFVNSNLVFSVNSFLKASQDNNVELLKNYLSVTKRSNINVSDSFGWTALMCAAANGARSSVEFLLRAGADTNIKDKTGMSVWNIARRKGRADILKLLSHSGDDVKRSRDETCYQIIDNSQNEENESFYCEDCKQNFKETTEKKHVTSTIHLLATRANSIPTLYHIPENNVGYKIMLKDGWDQEKGLGPSGVGMKYPVKTVLKRDRKGLGMEPIPKARVTHFKPNDHRAVKEFTVKKETKGERKRRERKKQIREKMKEINYRKSFNE